MNETFVGDTPKLVLKTSIDISGYQALYIKFKRPDDVTGAFAANLSSTNNKWMEAQLGPTDLSVAGRWTLQAEVKDNDGNPILHGKFVNLQVFDPITIP